MRVRHVQRYLGQKGGRSGCCGAHPDEVGQVRGIGSGNADVMAEIVPKGDAELSASQQQAGEGVPALASLIGAGAAGDLALDHVRPQIALGQISLEPPLSEHS